MTIDNKTLVRAVIAMIRATENTPALPLIQRSLDFRKLAAHLGSLPEIQDVDQLRDLKAQVRADFDLTEYERRLLALRDEIIEKQRPDFTRQELVLLHTLCGSRASQIETPALPDDARYKAELLALRSKIDNIIDRC